jgi:putative membrane-bound dehydrogenase-like protein
MLRASRFVIRFSFLLASAISALYSCSKSSQPSGESIKVRDGYSVDVAAGPDLVDYPMFATVDESGRLFVFESIGNVYEKTEDALRDPKFRINLLEDLNGDGVYDKSTIYADKVGFPQGGVFYKGSLYATSAPDLIKFTDTDGDGVADTREVLLSGWVLNVNANSVIGPFMGPDGWLYMASAIEGFDITTKEGERLKGETARIWRVKPDGSNLEWISAGGMNNPVELTFTAAAEVIGTETYFTNPQAGQRDALVYWTEGGIYPKPNSNITRDGLPLTGELMPVISKFSRVSPAGITRYRNNKLGDSFQGNLFSAQFNTHRVLRHKLVREGASFRTEDEVFFASDNEDFHPTDVLEDGDGSLLVVETGGWFIKGCPLSQVSKPELQGTIYRVRKKDAPEIEDPFGNAVNWASLDITTLVDYLDDPRPFVADKAINNLVDRGPQSVDALANVIGSSASLMERTHAVFALYRINSNESLAALRHGLNDGEAQVRIAAAKCLGMAKDHGSVGLLTTMIQHDHDLACKRQAATALGQLDVPEVIPALLKASEEVKDRYVEHAIIYALITMNEPDLVKRGLTDPSNNVKKAALIALDQMKSRSLEPGQVTPLLSSNDSTISATARWVVSHHPEWSAQVITYLKKELNKPTLADNEKRQLKDILVSFSKDVSMQEFVGAQMAASSVEKKRFMLEVMAGSTIKEVPSVWIDLLGNELTSDVDATVKLDVLKFIRLHGIASLNTAIENVADNNQNAAMLRIHAIGALLNDSTQLSNKHFDYLYEQLQPANEALVRQQAVGVLGQAKLPDELLLKLARDFLGKADAFMIPGLMPVFLGATDIEIGKALAKALENSPGLDNLNEEHVRETFASYPAELNATVGKLIAKLNEVRAGRLTRIKTIENEILRGDIERGRMLFFGKAICYTCHTIGKEGGRFGPDLTSIQRDRSAHDLVEAIVYPSVSFVREYETYRIKTKDNTFTGIIQSQTPDMIRLGISVQESVQIQRKDIMTIEILDTSMMPIGLDKILTEMEMADLLAFLLGQDQDPETDSKLLR